MMMNIVKALVWLTSCQSQKVWIVDNGNSYPINNKRGYAAKQKRDAKKAKRK